MRLLEDDEAPVFTVLNPAAESPFLLTADHAGRAVPRALGDMGVSAAEMERHIAWDIGIAAVTRQLAAALQAPAVLQNYSRLVMDCNRQPSWPSAFPEVSEATSIPGNAALSEADKRLRRQAIFEPYHAQIDQLIGARRTRPPIYVAMHSFTPVYLGAARGMHVAVLYHCRPRFSHLLAALLREEGGLVVAENDPYRVSDETDYGVPVHAEARGLDYVEIEIRQDLIADAPGQAEWAARLARLLPAAAARLMAEQAKEGKA
jgi:predicted N-formylglutamate amidohydrolase